MWDITEEEDEDGEEKEVNNFFFTLESAYATFALRQMCLGAPCEGAYVHICLWQMCWTDAPNSWPIFIFIKLELKISGNFVRIIEKRRHKIEFKNRN